MQLTGLRQQTEGKGAKEFCCPRRFEGSECEVDNRSSSIITRDKSVDDHRLCDDNHASIGFNGLHGMKFPSILQLFGLCEGGHSINIC